MRLRLPLRRWLLFAGLLAVALLATLPLRLAASWLGLDDIGLSARALGGSVWGGTITEAHLGPVPLGDLNASLQPLPLLIGRARIDLGRKGDAAHGAISVTMRTTGIDDATARLPLGSVFAPVPIVALDLDDVSARLRDGLCEKAEGRVSARIEGDIGGIALPGGLTGNARCDRGALLLPLVSQSGMERIAIRLLPEGRYRLDCIVRAADPALRERLLGMGFAARGEALTMALEGRL